MTTRPMLPVRLTALALLVPCATAQSVRSAPSAGVAPPARPADPPVLVVDPAGNGDFSEVADAVAAAPAGALVLVRSGVYQAPVRIDGRSLSLVADAGANVQLERQLEVAHVGAGSQVFVAGLALTRGFLVDACLGPVGFDGCVVPPPVWLAEPPPGTEYWQWDDCGAGESAQAVRASAEVSLVECVLHGADGRVWSSSWTDGAPGQHGLLVEASTVALYDCVLVGGDGGIAGASGHFPVNSGAGGDGLRVVGPGSDVRVTGLDATGGVGGTYDPGNPNGNFGVTYGCDGVTVRCDPGSVVVSAPLDDVELALPAVARASQPPSYTIEAPAGAPVYVMLARRRDWRAFPALSGHFHLASPTLVVALGTMPAGGVLQRPLPLPAPVSRFGHRRLEVQVYATIGGVDRYSEPRTVVVVDPTL